MAERRKGFYERFANNEFCIKFNDLAKIKMFQKELAEYLPNLRDGDANGYGNFLAKDNDYSDLCWGLDTEFHIAENRLYYTGVDTRKFPIPTVIYQELEAQND
jgi:ABC-type uncharacterized transport system YnjBCD substrate-binding protein